MTDPLRLDRPRSRRGEDIGDVLASIRRLIAQDAAPSGRAAGAEPPLRLEPAGRGDGALGTAPPAGDGAESFARGPGVAPAEVETASNPGASVVAASSFGASPISASAQAAASRRSQSSSEAAPAGASPAVPSTTPFGASPAPEPASPLGSSPAAAAPAAAMTDGASPLGALPSVRSRDAAIPDGASLPAVTSVAEAPFSASPFAAASLPAPPSASHLAPPGSARPDAASPDTVESSVGASSAAAHPVAPFPGAASPFGTSCVAASPDDPWSGAALPSTAPRVAPLHDAPLTTAVSALSASPVVAQAMATSLPSAPSGAASAAVDADAMTPAGRPSEPPLSPARTAALTSSLAEAVAAAAARMAETARLAATARRADASAAPGFPHLPLAAAPEPDSASQGHADAPPPGATASPLGSAMGLASPEATQGNNSPFRLGPDALIPPAFARPATGERGPQSPSADPAPMTSGADRPRLSPMLTVVEPLTAAQGTNQDAEPADIQPWPAAQPADAWPGDQPPGDCTSALLPAAEPLVAAQPHPDSSLTPATPLTTPIPSTCGPLTSTSRDPLAVPDRLGVHLTTPASPVTPEQQTTDQTNPAQPEPSMDAHPLRQLLREAIRDEMRGEIGQQIDTELRRVVREELAVALTEAFGRDLR